MSDFTQLPADLPEPTDDGAADHLRGKPLPHLALPSASGGDVVLDQLGLGRTVLYVYPMTGRPGVALPDGWDEIPGARGCTPEACGFRNHHRELLDAGASGVFGLSSQPTDYQQEVADRLHLPFGLLSDGAMELAEQPGLPTFQVEDMTLYKRLTMVVTDNRIEHAFYPVFPPNEHAQQVLNWFNDADR